MCVMTTPRKPDAEPAPKDETPVAEDEPGTNATQHEPNPREKPIPGPDPHHKYHPSSPYTAGNI